MKRLLNLSVAILLAMILTACGNNNDNNDKNNTTDDTVNNGEVNNGANTTGNDHNDMNNDANNNNGNNNNGNDFSFSDEAADKVAAMDGVDNATVVMMGNSAYVAVGLKEGTNESDDLKTRISDEVKNVNADIDKVYVSANPDFLKEINDYRTKYNNGQPVEGLFEEIGDSIKRVFPDSK